MSTVDGLTGPVAVTDDELAAGRRSLRRRLAGGGSGGSRRRARWAGWWFALPALLMYVVFELYPIITAIQYSFYDWDGINVATPVGLGTTRGSSPSRSCSPRSCTRSS